MHPLTARVENPPMDDDDDAISTPNGRVTAAASQPVTVAAPPTHHHHALALALPIQQPRVAGGLPTATPAGGGGGREDCWSEGATSVLIDAWGERYMELSRGNLKQQHWREVSDIVSSRDDYTKPHKTDVQCKNRIDTLKKKYKVEKAKITSGGGPSKWPFFLRLDRLIGSSPHNAKTPPASLPPPSKPAQIPPPRPPLQHFVRNPLPQPQPPAAVVNSSSSSEGLPPEPTRGKKRRETGDEAAVKELTRAILRFGEVYEKVETSKLQQATEMEKQRMGFAKELELQRMQFFLKTQLELSKMKRGKVSGNNNSLNHHQHHHHHQNNDSDDDESVQ
ncbi:hypothetical protein QJS04_geneDACA004867 [Acorus gramineus]|uniref:Myb/SANT-like DNA-binding domain-containing protein n=1 Tax=Acorus gramineus TaxID=55184 RepID=A0AAV9BSI5_ACOGR|nr:hypothetical protein QJS04_geneDACA004867 [Acorus gramineus]